jgi:hypothetical protein
MSSIYVKAFHALKKVHYVHLSSPPETLKASVIQQIHLLDFTKDSGSWKPYKGKSPSFLALSVASTAFEVDRL